MPACSRAKVESSSSVRCTQCAITHRSPNRPAASKISVSRRPGCSADTKAISSCDSAQGDWIQQPRSRYDAASRPRPRSSSSEH
eukprot:1969905-Prymnesium_polylepis.1